MVFAWPASLPAQAIEMRTGEVVVGRVIALDEHSVEVEVDYPTPGKRTIERADLAPRTMYAILAARIDRKDPLAHLELAKQCRGLGLFAHAISEARYAERLDPGLGAKVKKMVAELEAAIAERYLREAEAAFVENRLGSAQLAARRVLTTHAGAPAAAGARKLLAKIAARTEPDARPVSSKEVAKLVDAVQRQLDRTAADTASPAHGKMRDQRKLERAVRRLEKSWKSIQTAAAPVDDVTAADRLSSAREALRGRLTGAYLALGAMHLERRALPDADKWCNKACTIDAENKANHRLHELILQAKIVDGWY